MSDALEEKIVALSQRDPRYARSGYLFVLEALDSTIARLTEDGRNRHIGGRELLAGIRDLARERFGPLAKEVFNHWGILSTEDFGQVVFNMISIGLLQRRPQDSLSEFRERLRLRAGLREGLPRQGSVGGTQELSPVREACSRQSPVASRASA